ncbi:hypothetical protein C8J56DRAFT_1126969 [Mycena floridula]|nr:hypothetical protein C8J56DRAFT_1126969 [Mycena floridula]
MLQVCHAFRETFQHRIAWITILKAFRDKKCGPLACPAHDDLSTRSLDNLKDLAVLALRVKRGFRSHPLPLDQDVRPPIFTLTTKSSFQCSGDDFLLGLIPGTDFGLFVARSSVSCWDIVEGRQISSLDLGLGIEHHLVASETRICEAAGRWLTVIQTDREDGYAMMSFIITGRGTDIRPFSLDFHSIIVLAVDHNESLECPVISVVCRRDDIPEMPLCRIALNPGMLCIISHAGEFLSIAAINLESGREHNISTDIVFNEGIASIQFIEEELHFFINMDDHHAFYHFPRKFFPFADNPTPYSHLADHSKRLIMRNPEISHHLRESSFSWSSKTLVEFMARSSEDLSSVSVLFLEYEMSPENLQTSHANFGLSTDLFYDGASFSISAPSNVMIFDLIDLRKTQDRQRTYYLLQYENCKKAHSTPSFVELQFPAEAENVVDGASFEINAEKGEIVVAIGNKVLRLSYLP